MIAALALALLAPNIVDFRGGYPSELCQAVATSTKMPVACLAYDDAPLKPFQLKWSDIDDLERAMKPTGKQRLIVLGNSLSLFKGGLTPDIVDQDPSRLKGLTPIKVPDDANHGGQVSLRTLGKDVFPITSLTRLNLKKQIRIHWLYQRQAVALCVKGEPETEFLNLIAKTIGAKFSETEAEYVLDFDPASYRSRLLESLSGPRPVRYKEYRWGERYARAITTLLAECVKVMPDSQLVKVFKSPNESTNVNAPQESALFRAAMARLDAITELSEERGPSMRQLAEGYVILLGQIDVSKPVQVIFGPPANCAALFESNVTPGSKIAL